MNIAVCHANTHPPTAGIGNFAYNVAQELSKEGYTFHLFLRGSRSYKREEENNFVVHRCPYFKFYPINNHIHRYFVDRQLRQMKDEIDLLHLHTPISPPVKTSFPTVATIHTPLKHKREVAPTEKFSDYLHNAQSIVGRRIEHQIINKSDAITTVSDSVRNHLEEYGLFEEDVRITPNGVDTSEFKLTEGSRTGNQLLYTGRLAPVKGLPDLLEAIKRIDKAGLECKLVITGKGEYKKVLQEKVIDLGIQNKVDFTGFVSREQLVNLYQSSDAFIFPTYYEGLPTSVLEAMAAGLPIVSTNAPGVRDLIDHEETGLIGEPGDIDTLTSNILRVLQNHELRDDLGVAARQKTVSTYDWKIVSQELKSVYEQVAE